MAQIPRQFLGGTQIGSAGRRQASQAGGNPGDTLRAEALALASDRGLDLTPIGDALYKAGSEFVQMEKERKANEQKLERQKQQAAARSTILKANQDVAVAFQKIMDENLSDPAEARSRFYNEVQGIIDRDATALSQIGEFAQEPYNQAIGNMVTQYGPRVTDHAFTLSKELLNGELERQMNVAVETIGNVEDDMVAEEQMRIALGGILDARGESLSDYEADQIEKRFVTKALSARFKMKLTENPVAAVKYLDGYSDLPEDVRAKIKEQGIAEVSRLNAFEEREARAQAAAEKRQQEERYMADMSTVLQAERDGDMHGLNQLADMIEKGVQGGSYTTEHGIMLQKYVNGALDPAEKDNFTSQQGYQLFKMLRDPNVPVSTVERVFNAVEQDLSPGERKEMVEDIQARRTREHGYIGTLENSIMNEVEDLLRSKLAIDPKDPNNGDLLHMPGFMEAFKMQANAKIAQAQRDVRGYMRAALYANGAKGDNFGELQKQRNALIDNAVKQYGQAIATGTSPEPLYSDLEKAERAYQARTATGERLVDLSTLDQARKYHQAKVAEQNGGTYTEAADPLVQKAKERAKLHTERRKQALETVAALEAGATEPQPIQPELQRGVQAATAGLGPRSEMQPQGGTIPQAPTQPAAPPETPVQAAPEVKAAEGTLERTLQDARDTHGLNPGFMETMMQIESGGNPNAVSPTGATGLFQFTRQTGRAYGLIDDKGDHRKDPKRNAEAAAALAEDNKKALERAGVEVEDWMLYMAHQQGVGGVKAIIAAADKGAEPGPRIRRNMDLNGGRGMTPQEFLDMWEAKWNRFAAKYSK